MLSEGSGKLFHNAKSQDWTPLSRRAAENVCVIKAGCSL